MERKRDRKSFQSILRYKRCTSGDQRRSWDAWGKRKLFQKDRSTKGSRGSCGKWYESRMDDRACRLKCLLPERSCGDVRRFHRCEQRLHAIRWKISAHRDSVHGCKASGCKGRLRYRDHDVLWFWSILIKLEPIPRICLRSIRILVQNCNSRRWLQESTFHFPGVLPQNERGSKTLEPAICSITWCLQCTDRLRSSIHRWKRFHVRNLQWHWCSTNTCFLRCGYRKRKRYHHTGIKSSGRPVSTVYN